MKKKNVSIVVLSSVGSDLNPSLYLNFVLCNFMRELTTYNEERATHAS
jgi:hypothetical protein